jgi:hypothetical protein
MILAKIKEDKMMMNCRFFAWLLFLVFGLVMLNPAPGQAVEDGNAPVRRGYGFSEVPGEWKAQMSVSYLPSADIHSIPGTVDMADYRLRIARDIKLNDRLTLTLGGGYGLKHSDATFLADLPQDLHALFFEAGVRYRINDKAFASIKLSPGFCSDFKDLGSEDLRMPTLALGGYEFDNGITVVGGFMYRFGSRAKAFTPALGLIYQPSQYWKFDLVLPRPAVTYFASRQLQLFVAGDVTSDEYELKGQSFGAKAIKYSDIKAMVGVNYFPVPAVKISTAIGHTFDRKFVFYDGGLYRPNLVMDNVPFFNVSLNVGW